MKLYTTKAKLYDKMIQAAGKNYKGESALIAGILHKSLKEKNPLILDLGCGTGTHAAELVKQGFNVICGDLNKGMLAIARKKIKTECLRIDMKQFSLKQKVKAIICLYNTIMYNQNTKELLSTFSSCYNNMEQGGILILQLTNPALFKKSKDASFSWRVGSNEVIVHSTFTRPSKIMHHFSFIDLEKKKEESDWHEMRIFSTAELKGALKKCGFKSIKLMKEKATLYITCRKRIRCS
ncbi:MAG: class I SAM-dependent methyltransferase [Nanoarchaeota archaeon]|nr:class I SAM-dependent methyltransferase [Nanoarchaeota archaeon]